MSRSDREARRARRSGYHDVVAKPGPLLRLVHSLERRRAGRSFSLGLTLRRAETSAPVASSRQTGHGPRAYVIGAGERVDLAVPGAEAAPLLVRHVAIVAVPRIDGVVLRAISLHPERGLHVAPIEVPPDGPRPPSATPSLEEPGIGGVVARNGVRLLFDGYTLDVRAQLEQPGPDSGREQQTTQICDVFPLGQQLSFYAGASVKNVGDVLSSVTGPGGGGHAIPALVQSVDDQPGLGGTLVLRSRVGVYRAEVNDDELRRGLLIGRSRRCVLGRGFDENDGLSRVHALVLGLEEGVFAFDLASRYGLRDVSRPGRLQPTSRLDDGVGCLVYGAGYLTFEL
jgi:hypothetical protein